MLFQGNNFVVVVGVKSDTVRESVPSLVVRMIYEVDKICQVCIVYQHSELLQ